MSRLLLHKVNGSPPARAVMMTANVLGLKLDYKEPNILKGEHMNEEYTKKNPMRTVPILEDGDFVLADSHAICTYLINKYGGDKKETLYPSEHKLRAMVDQKLHFDTGILFQNLVALAFPTLKEGLDGPKDHHIAKIESGYQILNQYLSKSKYLAFDYFTVADICAGATVTTCENIVVVSGDKYPKTKDWIEGLKSEPCFVKENAQGVAEFGILMKKFWKINKKTHTST